MPLSSLNWTTGRSYQEVDASAGENSLQSIAFRSAVDLVASIVSEMHFDIFSGEGIERRKIKTPGYMLDPAGDGYGVEDWTYQACQSWFLRGNVYGNIIDAGPTGMLRQVDLFHPDRVGATFGDGGSIRWTANGRVIDNMFHRRAFPIAGVLLGASPIAYHADQIGLSISATRFGKSWFQDGGHPSGILSNSEADMSDEKVVRTAKDRFLGALFGTREPIVLGRGWRFDQIQVNPEESQFLQTQQYSEAQAARIMGAGVAEVLGYSTGSTLTYANIIDRDIEMLKYSVDRWLKRMERIWNAFTPRPWYAKYDRDSFLDTSVMQQWTVNQTKLDSGAYTINEIRAKNNDGPVDWGNQPLALTLGDQKAAPADPGANDGGTPPPDITVNGGGQ